MNRCVWSSLLVMATAMATNAGAADVRRFDVFELELTSATTYANPFRDVSVTATFTAPSGQRLVASGFHDGGSAWKVRLAPDEVGTWNYRTTSSDAMNAGLHNRRGSLSCSTSSNKGFIRPDPVWKCYFSFSDGTPFFPMVDACFWMPAGITDTQRRTYFDTRQAQGFNVIWFSVEPGTKHANATLPVSETWAWGGTPSAPDLDRLNLQYFRRLERILGELRQRGMFAALILIDYLNDQSVTLNPTQEILWARYAVSRLAAYTTVFRWEPTTEYELTPDGVYRYDVPGDDTWIRKMGALVHATDPYKHPVSNGMTSVSTTPALHHSGVIGKRFGNSPEVDVLTFQYRPDSGPVTWNGQCLSGTAAGTELTHSSHRGWNKPVMGTESGFEYLPDFFHLGRQVFCTDSVRRTAWRAFAGGGAGYSNGFIGTAFGLDGYDWVHGGWNFSNIPFKIADAGWAAQAGHYVKFITTKTRFWEMRPLVKGITSPNICLAKLASEYVVYAPLGGTISLDLSSAPGEFDLEWLNPRTGVYLGRTIISGSASLSFEAPDGNDWVLHLSRAESPTK